MAGASQDGLPKFARTNRDDYVVNLASEGTLLHKRVVDATITGATTAITAFKFVNGDLLFTALTNNALTGPLSIDVIRQMQSIDGQVAPLSTFTTSIENTDPANAKVITMGAGFTPASLTVPANSFNTYTWEIVDPAVNPPTIRLINTQSNVPAGAAGVSSFEGRTGAVVSAAGDYNSTEITNVSTVPGGSVTAALDSLLTGQQSCVFLNNNNGTITSPPTDGRAQDILVLSIDFQNSYVPSNTNHVGRIGAFNVGEPSGNTAGIQTLNNAGIEFHSQGLLPSSAHILALATGDITAATSGWSAIEADVSAAPAFGAGNQKNAIMARVSAAQVAGINGTTGAYALMVQEGPNPGAQRFWVNVDGNMFATDSGGVSTGNAWEQDTNGMFVLVPSRAALKNNIANLALNDTAFLLNANLVKSFRFNRDSVQNRTRVGTTVEAMVAAGASDSFFTYDYKERIDAGHLDLTKPLNVDERAVLFALIKRFQDHEARIAALEA